MVTFWLGTHEPNWLWLRWFWLDRQQQWRDDHPDDVGLFVAHHRFERVKTYQRARRPWALDSGGYGQITRYGQFLDTPKEYIDAIRRYSTEIGELAWAASQDWMTEDKALRATGLTVADHHRLTVENYVDLVDLWGGDPTTAIITPTVQGPTPDDYVRCWDLYDKYGVDLSSVPLLALGSVCRLQSTRVFGDIIAAVRAVCPTVALHGFGVKRQGLAKYGQFLRSADSLAWSDGARRRQVKNPHCRKWHTVCSSCITQAMTWRSDLMADIPAVTAPPAVINPW